jgi:hypothetical protein
MGCIPSNSCDDSKRTSSALREPLNAQKQVQKSKLLDGINQFSFVFPDCLQWNLDIDIFIDHNGKKFLYSGLFRYRDYMVILSIPMKKMRRKNDIRLYEIDNLHIRIYRSGTEDPIHKIKFPFTILHRYPDLLEIFIHYDKTKEYKDRAFFYDGQVLDIKPDCSRFVNIVERWIKWAIKYEGGEPEGTIVRVNEING